MPPLTAFVVPKLTPHQLGVMDMVVEWYVFEKMPSFALLAVLPATNEEQVVAQAVPEQLLARFVLDA